LFYKESEVKTAIMTQLSDLLGESSSQAMLSTIDQLQIFEPKFWASVISICTIIFTASTVFATLQSVLNDMFSVKAKTDQNTISQYIRSRLFSLRVIAGFVFLLLISLVLYSVLQMVGNLLDDYLGVLSSLMLKFGAIIIPISINTLLFALIFVL
jgi:membrane protein